MRQIIRHFTVLIILFLYIKVSAQPSLTQAVHQPVIGDIELRYPYLDTIQVSPGSAGLNVTWNFSNLNIGPTPDTVWYEPMISHFTLEGDLVARQKTNYFGFPFNYYDAFDTRTGHTSYRGWALLPFGPDLPWLELTDPGILHSYPMSASAIQINMLSSGYDQLWLCYIYWT